MAWGGAGGIQLSLNGLDATLFAQNTTSTRCAGVARWQAEATGSWVCTKGWDRLSTPVIVAGLVGTRRTRVRTRAANANREAYVIRSVSELRKDRKYGAKQLLFNTLSEQLS